MNTREWWIVLPHDPGAVEAGELPDAYPALPPPQSSRSRALALALDWERACGGWGMRDGRRVRYARVAGPFRTREEAREARRRGDKR